MPKQLLDKNNNLLYSGYETDEIVANPQLDGTETDLKGLQVGNAKYKVSSGGGSTELKYISVYGSIENKIFDFCLSVDTDGLETYNDLYQYLSSKTGDSQSGSSYTLPICGFFGNTLVVGVYVYDSSIILRTIDGNANDTYGAEDFSITYN